MNAQMAVMFPSTRPINLPKKAIPRDWKMDSTTVISLTPKILVCVHIQAPCAAVRPSARRLAVLNPVMWKTAASNTCLPRGILPVQSIFCAQTLVSFGPWTPCVIEGADG